jgi:predicted lipoprotein with Yx(FWY)xxD motif
MSTGNFTVITRSDGSHQWAYKTHPLYNFAGDAKPGDTNGNGLNQFGGIWTIARP